MQDLKIKKNLKPLESSKVPPSEGFREAYILHLADNALILAQQNAAWCAHGPILEQDIAITNISLDLIGQARNFYQYAAQIINESKKSEGAKAPSPFGEGVGGEVNEDSLAYLRDVREFKNCLLVEQPNGDWAQTIVRQFFFSAYQQLLYSQLQNNKDEQLAAIAAKALKEVNYHLRWSSEWVIRLADGTTESRGRIIKAIDASWNYTDELFIAADYEKEMQMDIAFLKDEWMKKVVAVFNEATISFPEKTFQQLGGKIGMHTEHLGIILAELQFMQRAYPNCEW